TEDLPGIREALVPGVRFVPVNAIDGMALDANVSIGPARAGLTEMRLRLDGSEIEGGFMLVDGDRPQLAASLRIDRLDTGALFPRGEDDGTTGLGGLDGFRQWLAGFDHALDLIIDRANVGRFRLQGITVKSRVRDGGLIIEELAIGDALDTTAHLSGVMDLDLSVIELDGSVAIASPARLLRDLGYDAPLVMSLLGPLRLDARMEGSAGRLNLSSTVEGDNIEGRFIAGGLPEAFDLEGELLAGSEGHVLAQLGALILDNPALAGDARLDFVWNGTQADPPAGRASLHLGDIALEGELALPAGDAARGSIEARNLDLGTAASFYRWLAPVLGLIPGPLDRWIGAWPKQRLQWDWPFRRPVELAFSAIGPDGADLASGDLRLSADSVALLPLEFTLGGGHVVIRSAYVPPELDLRLVMGAVESGALLASLGVEGGLSGPLDLELDLRGTGATVPRILATLAGTGTMSVSAGRMALPAGADPYPAFLSLGGDIAVERGMFESIDGSFMLPPGIDAGPAGGMGPDLGTGET
ncbi:MAG: hypothetical protein KDF64_06045, partial [Geminicoccaceae bacterium]|nr:hypothetical protein [Geminicoccaceae bacterium]